MRNQSKRITRRNAPKKQIGQESVIGIDLGGSSIRLAYVTPGGRRIGPVLMRPVHDRRIGAIIALLVECVRSLEENGPRPQAIGIGIPGFITTGGSRIFRSPNFPTWRNVPIRSLLESRWRVPIAIENDANAAAFGESWVGGGKTGHSLIYLGLGTGVGGGIILGRKIWTGRGGLAAEIGHITIHPGGPLCGCGNYGCLESYASATAVISRYQGIKKEPSGQDLSAREIYLRAQKGDKQAREIFAQVGWALGIAIADLMNIFDPERIAIGGGAADAWPLFYKVMITEARRRAIHPAGMGSKIKRAVLKDEAGIIGAAGLAYQRLESGRLGRDRD